MEQEGEYFTRIILFGLKYLFLTKRKCIMIFKLLEKVAIGLNSKGVSYMLSGSVALNVYAVPRMTLDIDMVVELLPENVDNFLELFEDGYYVDAITVKEESRRKGMFNIIDHETGYKIDFIVRKSSDYRKLEFKRRRKMRIENVETWVVSPEDLIISKIEWIQQYQSPKQFEDIRQLLKYEPLDLEYVDTWCKKLRLKTFNLI